MNYETLMKECIELAKLGQGKVSPNPLVGAIVLDRQGHKISEGFHEQYGQNHAERNALINLDNNITQGGSLIVNLEPCSHYGKTPPCADLIIEKGIKTVIIGMQDVNPVVRGNGIRKLKQAGITVVEGVLEDECRKLNEIFIKNMTSKKTFVAIKTATTIDGKIAAYTGSSKWITAENAREQVKLIRKKYDAILTSSGTVLADNPRMNHEKKLILDRELKTDFKNAEIYKTGISYVFYDKKLTPPNGIEDNSIKFIPSTVNDNKICLEYVLDWAFENVIMSVLIEAGGKVNGSALPYTDKIYHFIAPKILGDNKGLSCFDYRTAEDITNTELFSIDNIQTFEPDILVTYYKKQKK